APGASDIRSAHTSARAQRSGLMGPHHPPQQVFSDQSSPVTDQGQEAMTATLNPLLLQSSHDQRVRWSPGERLHTLFEDRCDSLRREGRADQVAVDTGDSTWTYEQLDSRANQLARYLLADGARAGDRI